MQTSGEMPPNYLMVYITVDDLQACLDKAESLGGETLVTPFEMPGGMGQIAVFRDPDGNTIRDCTSLRGRPAPANRPWVAGENINAPARCSRIGCGPLAQLGGAGDS